MCSFHSQRALGQQAGEALWSAGGLAAALAVVVARRRVVFVLSKPTASDRNRRNRYIYIQATVLLETRAQKKAPI